MFEKVIPVLYSIRVPVPGTVDSPAIFLQWGTGQRRKGGGRTVGERRKAEFSFLHLEKTNGLRRPAAEPPPPLPPAPAPANDLLTPSDGKKRYSIQGRVLSDT